MSYTRSSATVVPDPEPAEVLDWYLGPSDDGVDISLPAPVDLSATVELFEITALERFWRAEEEPAMTAATAQLAVGALATSTPLLTIAGRRHGRTFLTYGVAVGDNGASLRSVWPGVALRQLSRSTPQHTEVLNLVGTPPMRVALLGVPSAPDAAQPSLLERLYRATINDWHLVVLATPVPWTNLHTWHRDLVELVAVLSTTQTETANLAPTSSVAFSSPVVSAALELVELEEKRARQAVGSGGHLVEAWIEADTPEALRAAAAIAASALAPLDTTPRPFRLAQASAGRDAPGAVLLPRELAALIQPPSRDVPGLPVSQRGQFDETPEPIASPGPTIDIATTPDGSAVRYPLDRLTHHTYLTGATGSRKTSISRHLIGQVRAHSRPVWVLEARKSDYDDLDDFDVWRVGGADPADHRPFNPCEADPGVPIATHAARLIEILTASFGEPTPPLPSVIRSGMFRAYQRRGWDVVTNRNPFLEADPEHPAFPTLSEIIDACTAVSNEEVDYAGDVRQNVPAALRARFGALCEGPLGRAFDTDRPSEFAKLLNSNLVINLDLVADDDLALVMNIVLLRLWEARAGSNSDTLQHLLVIEEANRMAPQRITRDHPTSRSLAADVLGDQFRELRAAGQGLLVISQRPTIVEDAIANTGLKIIGRTPHGPDHDTLAAAINLDANGNRPLTALPDGDAAILYTGMDRPVLAHMATSPPHRSRRSHAAPTTKAGNSRLQPANGNSDLSIEALVAPALTFLATMPGVERARAAAHLRHVATGHLPSAAHQAVDDAIATAVGRAVEIMGQRLRIPIRARDRLKDNILHAAIDRSRHSLISMCPSLSERAQPGASHLCVACALVGHHRTNRTLTAGQPPDPTRLIEVAHYEARRITGWLAVPRLQAAIAHCILINVTRDLLDPAITARLLEECEQREQPAASTPSASVHVFRRVAGSAVPNG